MPTDEERYFRACHAMQSGVAYEMTHGAKDTEPKHLRVGVNSSKCDHTALVRLLIDKGIIDSKEYLEAIADEMEAEQKRYEQRNGVHFA